MAAVTAGDSTLWYRWVTAMKNFGVLSLLGSLLATAGCPSGKAAPDGAAPADGAPMTAAEVCGAARAMLVEFGQRCDHLSLADVEELLDPLSCQRFTSSVDGGHVRFDAASAPACLDALAQAYQSCSLPASTSDDAAAACKKVGAPQVTLGGACRTVKSYLGVEECAGDAFCKPAGPSSCGGVCVARIAVG
jgi:hypothetical protein